MAREIERKFLVRTDAWRQAADRGMEIRQAYLACTERSSIRIRIKDGREAVVTIKSASAGMDRAEFEYPVPLEDAREMLELRIGDVIEKTRYRVPAGDLCWEIDVFAGALAGLVVAEIELPHEQRRFDRPAWLGEEVTDDERFYNASLALKGRPARE